MAKEVQNSNTKLFSGMTQMMFRAWAQIKGVSAPPAAHPGGAWSDHGTGFGQVENGSMVRALDPPHPHSPETRVPPTGSSPASILPTL